MDMPESPVAPVNIVNELADPHFVGATLSRPKAPGGTPARVTVRRVHLKGRSLLQFAFQDGERATHRNLEQEDAATEIARLLEQMTAAVFRFTQHELFLTRRANGGWRVSRGKGAAALPDQQHDRQKRRILDAEAFRPVMSRLGILTPDGRIAAGKQSKARQVNQFLEIVAQAMDALPTSGPLSVIDCGCGSSDLTFALAVYLTSLLGRQARVVGLDRKADLLEARRQIAADLELDCVSFWTGDIRDYRPDGPVHLLAALHACYTATDEALSLGILWQAHALLAAPCCHQELARQLRNEAMAPLMRYGILRDRLGSLVTDAARALLLRQEGYSVQLIEFVDAEHTPQNLMIRAVRGLPPQERQRAAEEYRAFRQFWGIEPALERLLRAQP